MVHLVQGAADSPSKRYNIDKVNHVMLHQERSWNTKCAFVQAHLVPVAFVFGHVNLEILFAEHFAHEKLIVFGQKILSYRWESIKKEEASKTFDQIWEPSEKVRLFGWSR